MKGPLGSFGPLKGPAAARLLLAADLVLLGVAWTVSLFAYGRLPEKIASWPSVWTGRLVEVERSWAFFLYPILQAVFCAAYLTLTKVLLPARRPMAGPEGTTPDADAQKRLRSLKREVLYLGLIFFNLIFIHLQTSRILFSVGIGAGVNRVYFTALVLMVAFILVPYYRIRRKALGQ